MTFSRKKRIPLTHIEQVFGDEGSVSILLQQAGGRSIGAELLYSAGSFTFGKYPGLKRISTQSNGIGWALGCHCLFLSFMARDGSWFARCFGLANTGLIFMSFFISAIIFFQFLVLRFVRDERIPVHFLRIIPRQRFLSTGSTVSKCITGFSRGDGGMESLCVYRKSYFGAETAQATTARRGNGQICQWDCLIGSGVPILVKDKKHLLCVFLPYIRCVQLSWAK
ncbi:hypothetical protein K449DRAFT_261513 [Hypoxylon sp. EC38]|nr:hypothetical protein K449DRAFT_261513 [Hypoxylon sp. EC38]